MPPGSKDYFIETAKPVFVKMIEDGRWSPNCTFFGFYTLGSSVGNKSVTYDGFWLRLQVETSKPKGVFGAFALPILDIAYGRCEY